MFYIFQLGTDMLVFTCLYLIEIIFLITGIGIGINIDQSEKIFLCSFPIFLFIGIIIIFASKIEKYHKAKSNAIFHPSQTFRQRFARKMFFTLSAFSVLGTTTTHILPSTERTIFILLNVVNIVAIIISLVMSLFFESIPDKNDTICFKDGNIYYYMRVKKNLKNNKYMNSYIIPFDAIVRSYIIKNDLYIEFNRNHPDLQIHREFSTKSKRIRISFLDYPELKPFVLHKENVANLKLKKIKNVENSRFQ